MRIKNAIMDKYKRKDKMIPGLLILFGFLWIGELVGYWFQLSIPGSVIGMVLLTVALSLRIIKIEWVKAASDVLVKNIAFLFVPPGVGLMLYFDLVRDEWFPISISLIVSTFIVMGVTALAQQRLEK